MRRLFSSFVILLSLYGIVYPSYYFGLALSFTKPYLLARIILITALVAYTFLPSLRFPLTQKIIKFGGLSLLVFGLACLYSADFFGNLGSNVLIGDIALLIEGGILAAILGIELPVSTYPVTDRSQHYLQRLSRQATIRDIRRNLPNATG